jgi:hypothetical protein
MECIRTEYCASTTKPMAKKAPASRCIAMETGRRVILKLVDV